MAKETVYGGGTRVIVRDVSEPRPEPDETNRAIRDEYSRLDRKKFENEKKKKLITRIILFSAIVAVIFLALYLIIGYLSGVTT